MCFTLTSDVTECDTFAHFGPMILSGENVHREQTTNAQQSPLCVVMYHEYLTIITRHLVQQLFFNRISDSRTWIHT